MLKLNRDLSTNLILLQFLSCILMFESMVLESFSIFVINGDEVGILNFVCGVFFNQFASICSL